MPTDTASVLEDLRSRRSALDDEIKKLIEDRDRLHSEFGTRMAEDDEAKRPSDEEVREFNAAHSERRGEIRSKLDELLELDENVEQREKLDNSRAIAEKASRNEVEFKNIESQREPKVYRRDNENEVSYFLDLAAAQNVELRSNPDPRLTNFQERLDRHAKQMAEILPSRWSARKRAAEERLEKAESEFRGRARLGQGALEVSPFERHMQVRSEAPAEERAPSRIVGQGGYAIPPLWLIDEYIPALRPGRVAAGLCRQMPLPEGTDSINIPRLLTPTITGIQTADAAPVPSRDFSDTFQQANVKTVAGQEDVPIQLIEQSPGQILDRVLMTDLIADYNKQVDVQVITGSGVGAPLSGGQVVGIYPATNWGATTVTAANTFGLNVAASSTSVPYIPPAAEFFQFLGALASKTAYSRFNLRDFNYLMHPRRHFWSATGLDALGRPLGSDDGFGPYNAHEVEIDPAPYEGYAGRVPFGPSVYIDANVPITDNGSGVAGGTNDFVVGAIWDDLWLFEGDLRTRVLTEVLSGTLELRFQVYAYIAFLARYGVSITLGLGGTNNALSTANTITVGAAAVQY